MKILPAFLFMLLLVGVVGAVVIEVGVDLSPSDDNFSVNMFQNFSFDAVTVNHNEVILDNSTTGGFNQTISIEALAGTVNVSLIRVRNSSDIVDNFRLWIEFNATNTSASTDSNITIGEFSVNESIRVFHDGVRNTSLDGRANGTGFFTFPWSFDGRKNFEVRSSSDVIIVNPTNSTFFVSFVNLDVTSLTDIDTWLFSLDGAANVTFIPNITLILVNGSHSIRVFGNNSVGEFFTDIVFFTLNFSVQNVSFIAQANSSSTVEAFEVFRIRADVNVSDFTPSVTFEDPLPTLYVFNLSDSTLWGRWTMAFRRGSGADVGFFADIFLPPGDFTYEVVFIASDGAAYHTPFFNVSIFVPVGLPGGIVSPTRLLAEFVVPSPVPDGEVSVFSVLTIKATVKNAAATIPTARLLIIDEERNLLAEVDMVVSPLGVSDKFVFGAMRMNSFFTRADADSVTPHFYYIFLNDSDGNTLFTSPRRFYITLELMPEGGLDDPCDTIFSKWSAPFMTCMWKRYLIDAMGDGQVSGIRIGYVYWAMVFTMLMALAGALIAGLGGAMGLGTAMLAIFAGVGWVPLWIVYLVSIPTALLAVRRVIELLEARGGR